MNKSIFVAAAVIASLALAASAIIAPMTSAFAAITCENPGGNAPTGQQGKDACSGGDALTNVNPAGNQPAGFNK